MHSCGAVSLSGQRWRLDAHRRAFRRRKTPRRRRRSVHLHAIRRSTMFVRAAGSVLLALLAAVLLALPGSASAAAGGAQVLSFTQCLPFSDVITFCNRGHVVSNTV